MLFLGIDCGGSSTKALLADNRGKVISWGAGGPANFQVEGLSGVLSAIDESTQEMLQGHNLAEVSLTVGISGAGRQKEQELVRQQLRANFGRVQVVNDGYIAMYGGLAGLPGVAVISGTGSIAVGHNEQGEYARVGGWGYILGDEGSAFAIGKQALTNALKSYDGRTCKDKALEDAVISQFHLESLEELIPYIYTIPLERRKVASFAQTVTRLALEGNVLCQGILTQAGEELGDLAVAAIKRLGLIDFPGRVVTCGGTFGAGELITHSLTARVRQVAPDFVVGPPLYPPVVGALLLNYNEVDRVLPNIWATVKSTPYGEGLR